MSKLETIAVVGGSLAGLRTAEALRRKGYEGRLFFVGAETHPPYDRPPLSKEVLRGDREPEQIALAKPERLEALELELLLGRRAEALELSDRELVLEGGERLAYDGLVIATGASPRSLPGTPPLAGIHTLRTLDDCLAIRDVLGASPRVAVVGAGFIGAEVAASCRQRGLDVTLLEALPTPMARVLDPRIGALCADAHRDQGVDVRLGIGVAGFDGAARVECVRLADGSSLPADLVVVGIGVAPETGWLASSGLDLDDGVVCDATCATKAPGVVAAGDVSRWYNPLYGASMRVEHWTHAVEQADAAADRLLSGPEGATPFAPVPFVWSDQYDLKFQAAGVIRPDDEMEVVHGTLEERRFVALFGRGGRLVGALGVNRVRQLMAYRRMMREGAGFEDALAHARS